MLAVNGENIYSALFRLVHYESTVSNERLFIRKRELLSTLTAGNGTMRVVKLYDAVNEVSVKPRENARMVTYGDRLDAASMIVLAKKYHRFSAYLRFAEACAMVVGVALAVALSYISRINFKAVPMAALWHIIMCGIIRMVSKMVFLKETKKKHAD